MASTLRAVHTTETRLSVVSKDRDKRPGVRIAATTDHEQIRMWAVTSCATGDRRSHHVRAGHR